jgi:hypothetical protein
MYRNAGRGLFTYTSLTSGLAALTSRSSGWGTGFIDFDNDGWKDIFVAQSHVLDNVEKIHSGLRYLEPPALLRNIKGRFVRVELPELKAVAGRGAAFGDLDNDGSIDAVVSVLGGSPLVLHNRGSANRGVTVRLVGAQSNRDGLGAVVKTGSQVGYVSTAGSYLSASDRRVHLGLGAAAEATLEIQWPSGARQVAPKVAAGQTITVKEKE